MRALFISNSSGGMYSFRREVVENVSHYAETFLCAPADSKADYWGSISCEYIPYEFNRHGINPLRELKHIIFYKSLIKEICPDIVFTYTIKPNVYGGLACGSLNIPYIANVTGLGDSIENGGMLQQISLTLYKKGLKKASCVFFQNEINMNYFINNKIVRGNVKRIPGSGVNLEEHCFEEYPVEHDSIRFLFVARIKKDKGINELLEAIQLVRQDYPNCSVDVLGACEDDYSKILDEAERRGDIIYHGQKTDVHSYYKKCHCVVLPSYHEGTSNVLLEGSATGRPVIATNVPGCKEIFEEGITGIGCEPRDSVSLANAMRQFLKLSYDERRAMGVAARRKVERDYNRRIVIDSYLDEMNKAVKGE